MNAAQWAILGIALVAPGAAGAEPRQCLGRGDERWLVDQTLLLLAGPEAFENQLRGNACLPILTDHEGILFDYAAFETGFFDYLSPVYTHLGTYASVTPLSFLQFRADVAGIVVWPLPLDGAGYFEFPGYTGRTSDVTMPAADGRSALGLNVTLTMTLQAAVPLGSRVELQLNNSFGPDYFYLGDKPHYFNPRRDVVLKRSDYLVKNTALLALEIRATPEVAVRLGAVDDLTWVPGSEQELINQVFGYASVQIRRDKDLRDIEPFAKLGAYTSHGWRTGFCAQVGLSLAWALPVATKHAKSLPE